MREKKFAVSNREKLGHRLSVAAGVVIFAAVIITSCGFIWHGFRREISNEIKLLQETAAVFGSAIAVPMADGDRSMVQQALTSISKLSSYRYAEVLNAEGAVFVQMGFDALLKDRSRVLGDISLLEILFSNNLWVSDTIVYAGQPVGSVRLLADISDIRGNFFKSLIYGLAASLAMAFAATAISRLIIRRLTAPIYHLSTLMSDFGQQSDYSTRVPTDGRGEIGLLARSFNKMIVDLDARNRQLIEYQETLEERVEERTRDLKIAKDEADRANMAKSDFLATMSHEIRTPMNSMLMTAELLATSGLAPRHQRYADIIAKSGRSLLGIINDILDLSKIQAGKLELERLPVNINEFVTDAVGLFYRPAAEKQIEISAFVEPNVPEVIEGDPTRLRQILSNLINNALKFTETGSVAVRIAGEFAQDGPQLRFSITDTGIGISKENLGKIFDSFSQADQSTTRRFGGTGLGLTICRRLVTAMQGRFTVESEEGVGSSFQFTLPIGELAPAVVEAAESRTSCVLLAYPDGPARQVIADGLRRSGFSVVELDPDRLGAADGGMFSHLFASPEQLKSAMTQFGAEQASAPGSLPMLVAIGDLENPELEFQIMDGLAADCLLLPAITPSIVKLGRRLANGEPLGRAWFEGTAGNQAPPNYASARILLADDNAINREVAAQALARFGIVPHFAGNGIEAVEAVRAGEFDLVFMDCSMPEMDGFEATRRIRDWQKQHRKPATPIVALTAHLAETIGQRSRQAGMDAIVVKPFTMNDLADCLARYLTSQAAEAKPGRGAAQAGPDTPSAPGTPSAPDSPSAAGGDGIFDPAMLENLREIAGENHDRMTAQLRSLYCGSAPGIFDKLAASIDAGGNSETSSLAHSLKSMSFNIGAGAMGEACRKLEAATLAAGGSAGGGEPSALFADVEHEFSRLMKALEADNGEPAEARHAADRY